MHEQLLGQLARAGGDVGTRRDIDHSVFRAFTTTVGVCLEGASPPEAAALLRAAGDRAPSRLRPLLAGARRGSYRSRFTLTSRAERAPTPG